MNANNYVLTCSSTVDLYKDYFKKRNVVCVPFSFLLGDKTYIDDFGTTISYPDFYKAMADGASTKTSQPNVDDYISNFEKILQDGKDILHIEFSSGLSGAINSSTIAAKELSEKYPERKIYVVDSLAASGGYGLFVDKIADLRDGGMGIDELYNWALENRLSVHHWFYSMDLTFYVRGGRISKAAGWFGTLLKICPLLNVDLNGKLIPRFKIRGKLNAGKEAVKKMEEFAIGGHDYDDKCFITHSDCYEDASYVRDMIEEKFPKLKGKVQITDIGTVIGSHTGPGTVALFFFGKERND